MNRGLESGFATGISNGVREGMHTSFQSGYAMVNRFNAQNPNAITDPKLRPVFWINGENVSLTSGSVQIAYNVMDKLGTELLAMQDRSFDQNSGTTYRPPLVRNGLGGRNYIDFSDTGNRYLTSYSASPLYASTSPSVTATGMTYMFVIKRKQGGQYSILDGRDSTTLATAGDLLLEVDASGRITFQYCGGYGGTPTNLIGTAGINLLNDWSILTVKCQLRTDGLAIPGDSSGSTLAKRYSMPIGNKYGHASSAVDIFVNGVEQQKTITTNTWTNSDYYNDGTYRMLNRVIYIGNKGNVYGTSGTQIASALMIPSFISKGLQQRLENYFRYYYSLPM